MSVASCLNRFKRRLSPDDLALFNQIKNEYQADGATATEAGMQAIQELRGLAMREYSDLISDISIRGGAVPVGNASKFRPDWMDREPLKTPIEVKEAPAPKATGVEKGKPQAKRVNPRAAKRSVPEDQYIMFDGPMDLTLGDKFFTKIVDRFHSLTKVQKAIGPVSEEQDVDNAVVRYPGRARAQIEDFENGHQKELIQLVRDSKLEPTEIGKFLHARHAKEANKRLERARPDLAPDNKDLSGMSNGEAAEILSKYQGNSIMQQIGERVDQINNERVQLAVDGEILTAEEAAKWRGAYSHYVPLFREDVDNGAAGSTGQGFDNRGRLARVRSGSKKKVDYENMLARIADQYQTALIRVEKNRVAQAMYNLAVANPNPEFWSDTEIPQVAVLKPDGTVTYRPNLMDDYLYAAKFGGETKFIYFKKQNPHARQIAVALKNLNSTDTGGIVRFFNGINRYLAIMNTALSPEFVISNFFRDAQTAFYNLTDTEVKELEGRILKSVPKAMKGIHSALRKDGKHEWAKWFDEFRHEGGMTGWMGVYEDIHTHMKQIRDAISGKGVMNQRQIRAMWKWISDYNTIVENAIRVSTYRHGVEAGLSKAKAAQIAKEVTVNFNRRGEMAITANAFYLFYNAGVQGSARLLRAVWPAIRHKDKNPRLRRMIMATIAVAAAIEMANRLSTDDDEGPSKYEMAKKRYGDRNLIIMDWFGVTGDKEGIYLKIPLPWGYNVFHVLGQELGALVNHAMGDNPAYKPFDSVLRLGTASLQAFNPVQDGSLLQTISPTVIDPIARIAENKDWHGGPLYPNYDKSADNYTKFFSTARESSRAVSEWIGETFRDDETLKIPKVLDVSPEWLDMTWDVLTGSAGRFVADSGGFAANLITGKDIETKEIPWLRKVVSDIAPGDIKMTFYDSYYEILDIDARIGKQIKDGNKERAQEMADSVGARLALIPAAKGTKKKLTKNKNMIKFHKRMGNADMVKRLEEQQVKIMKDFMRAYYKKLYG